MSDEQAERVTWWGGCGACGPGTAWFGDSEEQVRALVEDHVKTEHVRIWRMPATGRQPTGTQWSSVPP